jgi:hypothetical protein
VIFLSHYTEGDQILAISVTLLHVKTSSRTFSGDKMEKNEMGGACSAYGGEERRIQDFGGET